MNSVQRQVLNMSSNKKQRYEENNVDGLADDILLQYLGSK